MVLTFGDGWIASLTQWTWDWGNSRRECRTGKPGVLHSIESQRSDTTQWLNYMSECESSTIKKAYHQRMNALELWWWRRRLLSVLWTAKRSNQWVLREISPEYSLEGLMLKLKLQYFGHLMQRADWLEKSLKVRKTEGKRRRGHRGWDG